MDCSPPGSSVHEILQARILEWVAISFSKGIFSTQGLNVHLLHFRQIRYHLNHQSYLYMTTFKLESNKILFYFLVPAKVRCL